MRYFFFLLLFTSKAVFAQPIKPQALDKEIQDIVNKSNVAGASVLIAEKGKIILNKGYGFAHLEMQVPATADTKYFIPVPGTLMITTAIMQLVEQGKISLDDELAQYLPHFPLQGKQVTLRHLITSTSGIPDYHYLGDPYAGQSYQPRTLDETIHLFSDYPLVSEPGEKFDWSISNYALLVDVLQKVTNESYSHYLDKHFIEPLSLRQTVYITPFKLIHQFAQGYYVAGRSFYPATHSLFKYDPSVQLASTAGDTYKIWSSIKNGKLLSEESYKLMTSTDEAKKNNSLPSGYGIRIGKEENYDAVGDLGAVVGFSNFYYYYPERDLTIIVLSNTAHQRAADIGRQIARHMLKLSPLNKPPTQNNVLEDIPMSADEMKRLAGTYVLTRNPGGGHQTYRKLYKRTVRVFVENGQLVLQEFGELPLPLLKQADNTFRLQPTPNRVIDFKMDGPETVLSINYSITNKDSGSRVGAADAKTFRSIAISNIK